MKSNLLHPETGAQLPLIICVSNLLVANEPNALAELLDIPPGKCLDWCRELRALAQSVSYQTKLYPSRCEMLRSQLENFRVKLVANAMDEKQRHD